tara:strand:+ start:1915 stop:2187 length:273 start_codon:yes stop_codon:yes gene_type:complete
MKQVNTYLPDEVLDRLQKQADYQGIPRSELIRERLASPLKPVGVTVDAFRKTVMEVRRRYSYGLDRQQAESIVACVVYELFNQSKNDTDD